VTLLTAILFGVLPAMRTTAVNLASAMKQTSRSATASTLALRGGKTLVALQVGLSMLLLIGAGLLVRTFVNLRSVDIGYDPAHLLFVTIDSDQRRPAQVEDLLMRFANIPGVTSVSVSQWPVFTNAEKMTGVCAPNYPDKASVEQFIDSDRVATRFFETWGIRFVHGRDFASVDEASVIVNETLAKQFWGRSNVVGESIGVGRCPGTPRTIVGVVHDHTDRQRAASTPMAYVPYRSASLPPLDFMTYAARTAVDPRSALPAMRRVITEYGANAPTDVTTGIEYRDRVVVREPALAQLFSFFGVFGLAISCLGVYGLLAYIVGSRTSEIGIRMALGAQRRAVMWMIMRESSFAVCGGILLGILAAFPVTALIESVLFGVSKSDAWTIGAASVLLLVSAGVAALLPAMNASRVDPANALRNE
jgi:predicted permease